MSLAELNRDYPSLVGRSVRIQGFLIFEGRTFSFYQGRPRPPDGVQPLDRGRYQASYWCASVDQPNPLYVAGLPRHDLARIESFARRRSDLVAQRVVLEGRLSARNEAAGEMVLYEPYEIVGTDRIGTLLNARVISVEHVFCAGALHDD